MTDLFDHRQVRRAFSRAAHGYDQAAALQREVGARLVGDAGLPRRPRAGRWWSTSAAAPATPPSRCRSAGRRRRWSRSTSRCRCCGRHATTPAAGGRVPAFPRRPDPVCADARALPLRDGSVDVLFSNLCLQWVEDLPAVFAGFRRVLKPDGLLLVSTFGPDTLFELRGAFSEADDAPHVSLFPSIGQFGDALIAAGFKNPVLDRDEFTLRHADLGGLMRELRTLGATNAMRDRRRSLTGRRRFARAAQAYERAARCRRPAAGDLGSDLRARLGPAAGHADPRRRRRRGARAGVEDPHPAAAMSGRPGTRRHVALSGGRDRAAVGAVLHLHLRAQPRRRDGRRPLGMDRIAALPDHAADAAAGDALAGRRRAGVARDRAGTRARGCCGAGSASCCSTCA